jgi:hypothetical protein
MNIFKNWFRKKHNEKLAYSAIEKYSNLTTASDDRGSRIDSHGVQFTLHKAVGGHIVELRSYDRQTDRSHNALHIIPNEKDFGEALNHIITYEALKR